MKKLTTFSIAFILMACLFVGCGSKMMTTVGSDACRATRFNCLMTC